VTRSVNDVGRGTQAGLRCGLISYSIHVKSVRSTSIHAPDCLSDFTITDYILAVPLAVEGHVVNRKPIFDAVRTMLGRGFSQEEVDALDFACDLAEAVRNPAEPVVPRRPVAAPPPTAAPAIHVLGSLSEEFESGNRGPETVSGGVNDPGGVSYGVYQLASKTGTCAAFVKVEGKPWAGDFASAKPGSAEFTGAWKSIAQREPGAFRKAQHAFIERTHHRPVIAAVGDRKGLDLDVRPSAVRDVAWSCAVQHSGAPDILIEAIDVVDRDTDRGDPGYDRRLIEAIYAARIAYVLRVAANPKLSAGESKQLVSITRNRYPKERANALTMLDGAAPPVPTPRPQPNGAMVDGRAIAAANGVEVKSEGVKIDALHPKMVDVIVAVADVARSLALPRPVITSGNDSKHMDGSLHFKNRALDFRGNNIKVAVGQKFGSAVADRLGNDYDVAFETFMNPANNHLHVEFDPR
jgi:hypothetical protein